MHVHVHTHAYAHTTHTYRHTHARKHVRASQHPHPNCVGRHLVYKPPKLPAGPTEIFITYIAPIHCECERQGCLQGGGQAGL